MTDTLQSALNREAAMAERVKRYNEHLLAECDEVIDLIDAVIAPERVAV